MIEEELIRKFILNKSNDEERNKVRAYFRENPEILRKYMREEDWNVFTEEVIMNESERIWNEINKKIMHNRGVYRIRRKVFYAAAAVFVLIFSGSVLLFLSRPVEPNGHDVSQVAGQRENAKYIVITNNDMSIRRMLLPDHSAVELYSKSSIRYPGNFTSAERNIYLTGKAKFHVSKDKKRPFTVFAGNTATTALGTVFTVCQKSNSGYVKVHLFEGKVVIKKYQKGRLGEVLAYLDPGNEFNNELNHTILTAGRGREGIVVSPGKMSGNIPEADVLIKFDDKPLTAIIDTLKTILDVNIQYDRPELENITYTGLYNSQKETLQQFLETIAMLNGLSVNKTKNGQFKITGVVKLK